MSEKTTIVIDPNGGLITIEVAATFAGVGDYSIYHGDEDNPFKTGRMTDRTPVPVNKKPSSLLGDTFYVIIQTASPVGSKEHTGAYARVLQDGKEVKGSKLESDTESDGMTRYDFEYTIKDAEPTKSAEEEGSQ